MTNIGIVGAGVAGLQLGLYLLKHGASVTLYTERTGDQIRDGRLLNTVALFDPTRQRDDDLGVNHWQFSDFGMYCVYLRLVAEPGLTFRGDLERPAIFLDMRLYLPTLLQDFEARGGRVVIAALDKDGVQALAGSHDAVVVASGRAGLGSMFPRVPEKSPYTEPQRRLFAGLFHGIRYPEPLGMAFHIVPGHGEIFENQFLAADGRTSGLLVEAIPGGVLEVLSRASYDDDPRGFEATLLDLLRQYAPMTYERIDPAAFRLRRPLDMLQGAVTPVVRRAYAPLGGGRFALALGDAYITHDPLTGQGANAASRSARLVGEAMADHARSGGAFDEAFCARMEERLWQSEEPVTLWSNAFLQPPPPHAVGIMIAAAQSKTVADAFVENFGDPARQWEVVRSPENAATFLANLGASMPAL
jgi:hypothetical protein